jgi:hypothetical protein
MIKLTITTAGVETDYTRYVLQSSISITESINIPSQLTFSMQPIGWKFVVPPQRAYVRLYSTVTQKSLFTGFIASAPVLTYLARSSAAPPVQGGQLFQYDIICTSDEYLLNIKAIPFIPAYVNQTQGQILTNLANTLCPGFFDCSMVASGDIVPFYQYDPTQSWCEVAKSFADAQRYRYHARDKKIFFGPYGDQPLGIYYDEATQKQSQFNPKALQTTVLSVPIVNDVTIVGDTEAGNNHEDYFLGDGFTANFPLLGHVFRGAETLLLQEPWNEATNGLPNSQYWYLQDPGVNFDFSAGALNVVDTLAQPFALGDSYLLMQNGLELAGGIDTQVGEVIFEDYCEGVLGGIYTDTTVTGLIAGFQITSPNGVVTSASGAAGVYMQPYFSGQMIGNPVISEINHTYVLQMVIHAPIFSRYQQIFSTIEGEPFGGVSNIMQGNITWSIQDYNIQAATGFFYSPVVTTVSVENVELPDFAVYALVNNQKLNLSITNTTVALMPLGGLNALVGPSGLFQPTGLILPMLPADSGGFIGTVQPWPDAASSNILLPPGQLGTVQQVLVMGNGFDLQAAQITAGQSADTLAFYAQSEPAAGTPVRWQWWEAQAAVSRLQLSGSIVQEAYVVGDDGIRSAIVTNLNPLPRTSEDCDNAAQAYLLDRTGVYYNGTYTCTSLFFQGLSSDEQFYPTCGRFLNVNAPRRAIVQQKFLVTSLTITMLEMTTELIQYQIQFGADTYLEKVIRNFVDLQPTSVLTPTDTAYPPNPRYTQNAYATYLPDLNNVQCDMQNITATTALVNVFDNYLGPIELRRLDTNWGKGQTADLIGVVFGPQFTLIRQQYDQQWFLRPVGIPTTIANQIQEAAGLSTATQTMDQWFFYYEGVTGQTVTAQQASAADAYAGAVHNVTQVMLQTFLNAVVVVGIATNLTTSRRSKVLRIRWAVQPAVPLFVSQIGTVLQFNFNGDMRNIYGFEMRASLPNGSGTVVLVQKPIASYADMTVDLTQTPLQPILLANPLDGFGINTFFFNNGWIYSQPLDLGLVTLDGIFTGAIYLTVNGVLAIGPNLAPLVVPATVINVLALAVSVKQAPLGADLVLTINQGGDPWTIVTLDLPAGSTQIFITQINILGNMVSIANAFGPLYAGATITLDILGDGGWTQSPEDLTVAVFY